MQVYVGIVRLQRFINVVDCISYGRFGHSHTPVLVSLPLTTCLGLRLTF
jgi:hypothetical protein